MKQKLFSMTRRLLVLCVGWFLIRYPLVHLHGMYQWPMLLLIPGIIVVVIGSLCGANILPELVAPAYLLSFFVGYFFHSQETDPGGGAISNLWIIWTVTYILTLLVGLYFDLRNRK